MTFRSRLIFLRDCNCEHLEYFLSYLPLALRILSLVISLYFSRSNIIILYTARLSREEHFFLMKSYPFSPIHVIHAIGSDTFTYICNFFHAQTRLYPFSLGQSRDHHPRNRVNRQNDEETWKEGISFENSLQPSGHVAV